MTTQTEIVTASELLHMPDDGWHYELVKGELKRMAPAGHEHGEIAVRLTWRLAQYVEENGLGAVYAAETGFFYVLGKVTQSLYDPFHTVTRSSRKE